VTFDKQSNARRIEVKS